MKKHLALSVVAPAGDHIRSGAKTLEVRSWSPGTLPLRDLLIVQNQRRLSSTGLTEDPDGIAMALVDVVAVREWCEDEVAAACSSYWEPGWLAWELINVRPIDPPLAIPARLRLYEVPFPALLRKPRAILFDWGDTLMSEEAPPDVPRDISMAYWPEIRALEGATDMLAHLSSHYVIGVATNATISKRADIRLALERAGLSPFIEEIFCRTEIGCAKDDPHFWDQVLAKLNLPREDVLMIGDSLEQDVLAPRAAHIAAIWFNWKKEPLGPVPAGVPVIDALKDLLELIPTAPHARLRIQKQPRPSL